MSHELEVLDGNANMLFVGETPWHRLGHQFTSPPSIDEVIARIRADRPVAMRQLSLNGNLVDSYATVRIEDNGTETVLGAGLGKRFEPLQDDIALKGLEPLLVGGFATIETAGYLRGGRVLFATAKLHDFTADVVPGDPIQSYAALTHAHDGTLAIHCGVTDIRVVCANTQRAALSKDGRNFLRLRHTRGAAEGVRDIAEILATERGNFTKALDRYRTLARRTMTREQFRAFAKSVFKFTRKGPQLRSWAPPAGASIVDSLLEGTPAPQSASIGEVLAETEKQNEARSIELLSDLFEGGRGNDVPNVRGTRWAAFNAVTEFLTHRRGRSDENRILSTNYGDSGRAADRALEHLLEIVTLAA